jgi:hypothetical protein
MAFDQIPNYLQNGFERDLYEAAQRNLSDLDNPLRFNNFAYAMRELVRHVLERLAPDASLLKCSWYEVETQNRKPSRRQRARFAVQGGLGEDFIRDTLRFDAKEMQGALSAAIVNLSKFTHVAPGTLGIDQRTVDVHVEDTLGAVETLFSTIDNCRSEIVRRLWEHIDKGVFDEALRETIGSIDELATHHSIEHIATEEVSITSIDADTIYFDVAGTIEVELQWGSNSDLRNGEGATMQDSFPFTCKLSSPVDDPSDVAGEEDGLRVDTSSWYNSSDDGELGHDILG